MIKWFRVVAPYFVAGGFIENDRVKQPAPIIHYMRDNTIKWLHKFCKSRKWNLELYETL